MGLMTHLGPILAGTVKNTNAVIATSATPNANFLTISPTVTSTFGGYRNTGPGDAYQFIAVAPAVGLVTTSPVTFIPTYTVGGVTYPIVIPAGSYIDNINCDITTAITIAGGAPAGLTLDIQLLGGVGSAYATAQTVATIGSSAVAPTGTNLNIGRYTTANSRSTVAANSNLLVYNATAGGIAALANTGVTDVLVQILLTVTTPAGTSWGTGAFTLGFDYTVRNFDGTWYPQTPPGAPQTTFPITY